MFSGNFWKFAGAFLAIMVVAGGGFFVWDRYFSKDARGAAAFRDYQKQVEKAYKNDTYGGATPEETLKLFVEALKKEDVELASKYFALDDNLSREKWTNYLNDVKNKNLLGQMTRDLERAVPDPDGPLYKSDFGFVIYTSNGLVGAEIDMELNPISKLWKIENL